LIPPSTSDKTPSSEENNPMEPTRWDHAVGLLHLVRHALPRPENGGAWLRLLRLPNLLTVPGDVLAGFLLTSTVAAGAWGKLLLAIPASLMLYAAGLLLNDLFDYAKDLRERPERPLPSGAVDRETVAAAALILLWIATFLAAFFDALSIALPLILCLILYDIGLKKIRILGPILMGLCRGGNLLLGAAAASGGTMPSPAPIAAAILLGLYIAVITYFARNEAQPDATIKPPQIGKLLRMLIPLQALFCVVAVHRFPANLLGLLLLPLLRVHRRLSTRFPPS